MSQRKKLRKVPRDEMIRCGRQILAESWRIATTASEKIAAWNAANPDQKPIDIAVLHCEWKPMDKEVARATRLGVRVPPDLVRTTTKPTS